MLSFRMNRSSSSPALNPVGPLSEIDRFAAREINHHRHHHSVQPYVCILVAGHDACGSGEDLISVCSLTSSTSSPRCEILPE